MLERIVTDPAELKRRGMTQDEVMAALAAHRGGRLPKRLGPKR